MFKPNVRYENHNNFASNNVRLGMYTQAASNSKYKVCKEGFEKRKGKFREEQKTCNYIIPYNIIRVRKL